MWLVIGEYRGPANAHAMAMYAVACARRYGREYAYRSYVADSLHPAPQGRYLAKKLDEAMESTPEVDADAVISRIEAMLDGET